MNGGYPQKICKYSQSPTAIRLYEDVQDANKVVGVLSDK